MCHTVANRGLSVVAPLRRELVEFKSSKNNRTPLMIDPMNALVEFQKAFRAGDIPVQRGHLDTRILVAIDRPQGQNRFNYMRADGKTLTVLVMFAQNGLEQGCPVFNIGYAVAPEYRGSGLAKSTLIAGLAELSVGLARAQIPKIHIEAVISPNNLISQAVARAIFDSPPTPIIDSISGDSALQYIRAVVSTR